MDALSGEESFLLIPVDTLMPGQSSDVSVQITSKYGKQKSITKAITREDLVSPTVVLHTGSILTLQEGTPYMDVANDNYLFEYPSENVVTFTIKADLSGSGCQPSIIPDGHTITYEWEQVRLYKSI